MLTKDEADALIAKINRENDAIATGKKNGFFKLKNSPSHGKFQQLTDAVYDIRQEQKLIRKTLDHVVTWVHTLSSQLGGNCDLKQITNEELLKRLEIAEAKAEWTRKIEDELNRCNDEMYKCGLDEDCIRNVKMDFPPTPWTGQDV